jgi:hypothetical protein
MMEKRTGSQRRVRKINGRKKKDLLKASDFIYWHLKPAFTKLHVAPYLYAEFTDPQNL